MATARMNCPYGWPLEVAHKIQVCRKGDGSGNWRCGKGWKRLDRAPYCKPSKRARQQQATVTQGSPLSEKATVELGVFMSRLKTIIIPRFSKPKYVEDEEGEHHGPLPSACIFVFRVQLLNLRSCCQSTLRIPLQRSEEVASPAFSRCRASFAPH